ncbi:hypothetical protein, partial [Nostoc sp.]|uniref:hypothetical protein n=1 Tax=Nostoc sp. TaxID=1180 RepID=UPI002FF80CEF
WFLRHALYSTIRCDPLYPLIFLPIPYLLSGYFVLSMDSQLEKANFRLKALKVSIQQHGTGLERMQMFALPERSQLPLFIDV